MVWSTGSWSDPNILIGFVAGWTLLYAVTGISDVVINMRLSPPTIAATQFSIFMAVSNMGISLAGILVAGFVVLSEPKAMLILLMAVQAVSVIILLIVKFPTKQIGNGVSEASGAKDLAV
jgi:PAT family beta-lactamase induction signal transducer AmpG